MGFSYEIQTQVSVKVFSLIGKIMTDEDLVEISKDITTSIEKGICNLVFDLKNLNYINSTGINMFMRTLTKARVNNGDLIFSNVNGTVSNLFKIAKLNEIYTIYTSQEEAVNHFKNK